MNGGMTNQAAFECTLCRSYVPIDCCKSQTVRRNIKGNPRTLKSSTEHSNKT